MKAKFNSFLDDIVTRPSVAYAAFVSYFSLINFLLYKIPFVEQVLFEDESLSFFLTIYAYFLIASVPFLLIVPTYVLVDKEKDDHFRLKYRKIFNSYVYKWILFLGIILSVVCVFIFIFIVFWVFLIFKEIFQLKDYILLYILLPPIILFIKKCLNI